MKIPLDLTTIGALLPVLAALLSKSTASSKLRALIAATLALVAVVIDSKGHIDAETLGNAVIVWGTAVAAYVGGWQHLEINNKIAPNFGLGPAQAG